MFESSQQKLILLGVVAGLLGASHLSFLASVPLFAIYMRGRVDDYPMPSIVSLCVVLLIALSRGSQAIFVFFVLNVFAPTLLLSILWLWRRSDGRRISSSVIVDCVPVIALVSALLGKLFLYVTSSDDHGGKMIWSYVSRGSATIHQQEVALSRIFAYDLSVLFSAIATVLFVWLFSLFWLNVSDRKDKSVVVGNPSLVLASVILHFSLPSSSCGLLLCIMYPFMRGMIVLNGLLSVRSKFVRVLLLFAASFFAWTCGVIDAMLAVINILRKSG